MYDSTSDHHSPSPQSPSGSTKNYQPSSVSSSRAPGRRKIPLARLSAGVTQSPPPGPLHSKSFDPPDRMRSPSRVGSPSFRSSMPIAPAYDLSHSTMHDMDRVISLFNSSKFYFEGFVFRRVILHSDGLPPKRTTDHHTDWVKCYVQLAGTSMSCWDAAEMDLAARQGRQVAPSYTNITDARVYLPENDPLPISEDLKAPTSHVFFLNSAGRNKLVFACPDPPALISWITAIRLASWERSRMFEIYTGSLFAARSSKLVDSPATRSKTEGWLMVRLPGDTEWTRAWCVVTGGVSSSGFNGPSSNLPSLKEAKENRWNRRNSLFRLSSFGTKSSSSVPSTIGTTSSNESDSEPALMFYTKKGTKKPLGALTAVTFAAAVYPESKSLIASSTMFKVEGRFHTTAPTESATDHKLSPAPEGFILATLGEGNPHDMLGMLLGIMDAFTLYGRPIKFNYDPTDPLSFYFACPAAPYRDHLFLDRKTAERVDIHEASPSRFRSSYRSLAAQRMQMFSGHAACLASTFPAEANKPVGASQGVDRSVSPSIRSSATDNISQITPITTPTATDNQSSSGPVHVESPSTEQETLPSSPKSADNSKEGNHRSTLDHSPSSKPSSPSLARVAGVALVDQPVADLSTSSNGDLQDFSIYAAYQASQSNDNSPVHSPLTTQAGRFSPLASRSSTLPAISTESSHGRTKPMADGTASSLDSKSSPTASQKVPKTRGESEGEEYQDMLYMLSLTEESNESGGKQASKDSRSGSPTSSKPSFLSRPPDSQTSERIPVTTVSPASPASPKATFPSSFAAGKKSAARLAAVQAAQAEGKAAGHRPGKVARRLPAKKPNPQRWTMDSDDDEEDEDEDDADEEDDEEENADEDERLKKHRQSHLPSPNEPHSPGRGAPAFRNTMMGNQQARQAIPSFYGNGYPGQFLPGPQAMDPGLRPMSQFGGAAEMGQFPNSAARREIPAVLRDQPAEPSDTSGLRPAISEHGLLHRVMQERQEKSAKSLQEAAQWTGEPLVHVDHKPPPPQAGLLGAIASHERDRKRDGGMGAALTERARERALRQREEDIQRQSMMMMAGGMGVPMMGAGYPPGMVPMMYNPQMMTSPTYEQMMFQQHQLQMQQQAMFAAQQAYMGYNGFVGNPGGMMNPMMMNGTGGMISGHQSMYNGMIGGGQTPMIGLVQPNSPNYHNLNNNNNQNNQHHPNLGNWGQGQAGFQVNPNNSRPPGSH